MSPFAGRHGELGHVDARRRPVGADRHCGWANIGLVPSCAWAELVPPGAEAHGASSVGVPEDDPLLVPHRPPRSPFVDVDAVDARIGFRVPSGTEQHMPRIVGQVVDDEVFRIHIVVEHRWSNGAEVEWGLAGQIVEQRLAVPAVSSHGDQAHSVTARVGHAFLLFREEEDGADDAVVGRPAALVEKLLVRVRLQNDRQRPRPPVR